MADSVEFNIEGADDLVAKFASITDDIRRKGGRSALRKAAQVVANKAKEGALAFDDPGTGRSIADNIALRWNGKLFKQTEDLGFRIGVLNGAKITKKGNPDEGPKGPTPHWRLLEFGTSKMRAQPFMRKALADNISEVTNTFISEYNKAIDRAIKRAAKKAAQGG